MSEFSFGDSFSPVSDRTSDFLKERDRNAKRIIPCGISYVDDCCLGLHPTDLMIVSAGTGAGKTTAGMFMAANAARAGRKAYYFALEAFRGEIEGRLLFREVATLAYKANAWKPSILFNRWMSGLCPEVRQFEEEAVRIVNSTMGNMHTLYRSKDFTHEDITKQFRAVSSDASVIVLDHLHFVDIDDESENRGMKRIIKAVRDVSLGLGVPVVCIAHLRKANTPRAFRALPEVGDIHGSSDIAKIATKIVMLSACPAVSFGDGEKSHIATTAIQVLKDRYAGASNYVGLIGFDLTRMEYRQKYYVARLQGNGHTLSHLYDDDVPFFAKLRDNGSGLRHRLGFEEETKLS